MAVYLTPLISALRAAAVAVWPEVIPNGVWESEAAEMVTWEALTPPYGVIVLGEPNETDDYGGANEVFEIQAELYFVAAVQGDRSNLRTALEAMRDYLYATGLTEGQVLKVISLSHSDSLPPNEIFAGKNYTHAAGRIVVSILDGDVLAV